MTYQILEKYSYTMEQKLDKSTDKSLSNVPSTPTHISREVSISTVTYTYVSPVESKVTVYKSLHSKRG